MLCARTAAVKQQIDRHRPQDIRRRRPGLRGSAGRTTSVLRCSRAEAPATT